MVPREEAALDAALADTFPASDPPSQIVPVTATGPEHGPAGHWLDLYRVLPRAEAEQAFGPQSSYQARRWSSEGTPAVYASLSAGSALLEALAHMEGPVPDDLMLAVASLPVGCVLTARELPKHWREYPYRENVQHFGDRWLASQQALALKVPSAICDFEFNVVINPQHRDRERLHGTELIPLTVDPRVRDSRLPHHCLPG